MNEPNITIDLEGGPRRLRFRHRDLSAAEEKLNRPLLGAEGVQQFWLNGQAGNQAAILLFAGLLHENPNLTLDEVRNSITFENDEYIDERLAVAIDAYLTPYFKRLNDKVQKAIEEKKERPTDGTNSGSNLKPSPSPTSDSAEPNSGN